MKTIQIPQNPIEAAWFWITADPIIFVALLGITVWAAAWASVRA